SATGPVSVSSVTDVTATAAAKLIGTTLTLSSTGSLGSSANPLTTQGSALALTAGDGGIHVSEADGATIAATATNAGAISIANATGTLSTAGTIATGSGAISLSSGDGLVVDNTIGSGTFTGTIALAANTDGSG